MSAARDSHAVDDGTAEARLPDSPHASASAAAPAVAGSAAAPDAYSTGIDTAQWRAALGAQTYKPHQSHPTPSPGSGDRVFYESLYREDPSNEMALLWCIEHGVFLPEEHEAVLPAYERAKSGRKKGSAGGGGAAVASAASPKPRGAAVPGVKKPTAGAKKRAAEVQDSSAVPVDAGMAHGGMEMVGAMTF